MKADLIGLLFPRRCPVCHEVVEDRGESACRICRLKLSYVKEPSCRRCGKPLLAEEQEYCRDCAVKKHMFRQGRAPLVYDEVMRRSISRFKYGGRREYAGFYAEEILRKCGKEAKNWGAEVIVPIPLHPSRRRKRGYNQAELLAAELSGRLEIPVDKRPLYRVKKTKPQKELSGKERAVNRKGAFAVRGDKAPYRKVLLVDDIYTTGSTIDEATRILLECGVGSVYFLCICVGRGS